MDNLRLLPTFALLFCVAMTPIRAAHAPVAVGPSRYPTITYHQLRQFLAHDRTDAHPYTHDYNCVNFSTDLIRAANKAGIDAWPVGVVTTMVGHEFVAFETSDDGMVWVEPQNDSEYDITYIGEQLCGWNGCLPGTVTEIAAWQLRN